MIVSLSGEKLLDKVMDSVREALLQYPAENVDLIIDDETNCLCIMYHSRHDSFLISKILAEADKINLHKLTARLDDSGIGIGHVW